MYGRLVQRLTTIVILWLYFTRWPGRWLRREMLPERARRVASWKLIRFDDAMKRAYIPFLSDQVFRPGPGSLYMKLANQSRNPNTDPDRMRFGIGTDWPEPYEADQIAEEEMCEEKIRMADGHYHPDVERMLEVEKKRQKGET